MSLVPPHDLDAERSALGGMMLSRSKCEDARAVLTAADFYMPAHGHVFAAIGDLASRGQPTDPVAVCSLLGEWKLLERVGGRAAVLTVYSAATASTHLAVQRIVALSAARRLIEAGTEIRDLGYEAEADAEAAIGRARAKLEAIVIPTATVSPPPTVEEFVSEDNGEPDWLVPGALERGDRAMVVSGEGVGKSTLLRQVAIMGAAALNAFTFEVCEPFRSLIVDLESGERLVRRKLRALLIRARLEKEFDPDRVRVLTRPEGIDLTKRADAIWLTERIVAAAPDLICFGPLYKSYTGDMGEEENARVVASYIDRIRATYSATWLIESHAPHAQMGRRDFRPFGSSLWLRWPELGAGFRVDDASSSIELQWFRRPRDERPAWPDRFQRGGAWPWTPVVREPS